ncbi:MAG TPA: 4Fe-4S dicluster domain-containing protein [Polyangiaceae bacterium]
MTSVHTPKGDDNVAEDAGGDVGGQATHAYWQTLAQWIGAPDESGVHRRELLKLLGASLGLAGVAGCAPTRTEKILPYTVPPKEMTPGIAREYATSMEVDGFATGLLVRSNDGRPTKIEGNPDHPASLGAAGAYEQASVLGLYDPHRARASRYRSTPASYDAIAKRLGAKREDRGSKLRILLEPTGSPLALDLLRRIQTRHPEAKITFYAPARTGHPAEGGRLAFGTRIQPQYDFTRADVILSIGADFLGAMPFQLRYARQFAERRRTSQPSQAMNRLYVVESMMSPTGSIADHRLRRKPGEIAAVLGAVAAHLAVLRRGRTPAPLAEALAPFAAQRDAPLIEAIARDLARRPEASVVIVGEDEAPEVHALGYWVNTLLADHGPFFAIAPTLDHENIAQQSLADLVSDMARHAVDTLVILGGNPAYTAPSDLDFPRRVALVKDVYYLGLHENETARQCAWFIPAVHYLESWGDARAYDGTVSLVQPLIEPLFGGHSGTEVLALLAAERAPDAHTLLRAYWQQSHLGDFRSFWEETLRRGVVAGTASPPVPTRLDLSELVGSLGRLRRMTFERTSGLELAFFLDPGVYDGRFANNAWLQEFPRPMTKLTWDNAAQLSPATAAKLAVENEDIVEIRRADRVLRMPVLVVPGHADDALSVHLGYGRDGSEELARGIGVNVYPLRTLDGTSFARDIGVRKVAGLKHPLALTQVHFSTEGRPIALSATLAEWRADPDFAAGGRGPLASFFAPNRNDGQQWAMTIDTSICTGCGACMLGCQSENNIFVVGKESVLNKREMHWLRIDTYYAGTPDEPEVLHEPMLCQHCEKAPCEYVCPVNATVHSPDGLNEMVYNRCVGTRFCSNNCPYKVRRFNWFDWVDRQPANQGLVKLQRNPNVTARERGVMEKCTYCVQRIRAAEITSRNERRVIKPGEVVTACQQACPTQAIQFDSLAHAQSKMVQWRNERRAFSVLHELGTEPRTRYLARIRNPNPEIGG